MTGQTPNIGGKRVAFLFTDGVEESEYVAPRDAVAAAGGKPELISLKQGPVQGMRHTEKGEVFQADLAVADADPAAYDALVLPGGVANPDRLRTDEKAVAFVRAFFAAGKPVAAICHGPWTLIEADAVRGRTVTSWPSLRTDLRNAGATWVDEEVHTDSGLVTSRKPDDLPAFCAKLVEEIAEGPHAKQRVSA
ncbi:protease [Pilimelia anulata]|uniref:Protease n=1 Tax=Pilimelia anulata TaxID=53371 RepID=A0A8J3F978_9ACTN|nr:type 1 glutamine amidotransferase domain-containing protein [Pilimelia anulata]GGJ96055.1 protease [Pilimelia anulata]